MHCNVEFGYQFRICSRNNENHGKPLSSWPVARSPGFEYMKPHVCHYLCYLLYFQTNTDLSYKV
jgi:hypothetical protein